jgi:hypothetical protein
MRFTVCTVAVLSAVALSACGGGADRPAAADGSTVPASSERTAKRAALTPETVAPHIGGRWTAATPWPFLPIHAALTPDGRVLTYGGNGGNQGGEMSYDVWDPQIADPEQAHLTLPNGTRVDTFCSAGLLMPQTGNVVLASGDVNGRRDTPDYRNRELVAYDYRSSSLTRLERGLNHPRWYGTMTQLTSGELFIQGGVCWNGSAEPCGGATAPTTPEIYRAGRGWVPLHGARDDDAMGDRDLRWWYPRAWQAPDGRVFSMSAGTALYTIDPAGEGAIERFPDLDRRHFGATNSAVMFRPGRILVTGGGGVDSNGREPDGSPAATVIDITSGTPELTPTQPMSQGRQWHNATVLPDGRVLVTGGSTVNNVLEGVARHAEIWDPDTGTWTQGNAADTPRLYHSFALLLPDGRVLTGGGGSPGPGPYISAEVYSPPYLFTSTGAAAARPVIESAPGQIGGASAGFAVGVTSDRPIGKLSLVGAGAVTHSVDMGQRYVELSFSQSGDTLTARLPANRHDLPPGFYMLFAVDTDGVPSVARMVRVLTPDIEPSPDQEVDGNLVHNGSFEAVSHAVRIADGDFGITNWPGWFNDNGNRLEIWRRHGGITTPDGQYHIELDTTPGRDRVYQTIDTVAGERYRLSLRFAPRPGWSADSNAFEVTWNGQVVGRAAPDGNAGGPTVWQQIEFEVIGTGRDRLSLDETGADDGYGALIDDVRLEGSANRLVNGSFEVNTTPDGGFTFEALPGWTSTAEAIEVWRKHQGYTAASGQSWIEVDLGPSAADRIEQGVATTAGHAYRLTLSFAARPLPAGFAPDTNDFHVYWNGTLLETIRQPAVAPGPRDLAWRTRSWVVVGTGQDRLALAEAGADDGHGVLIDAVSLVEEAPPQGNADLEVNASPDGGWSAGPIIGWTNPAGPVETWRSNHRGIQAASGVSHAELDVGLGDDAIGQWVFTQPGRTYRIVYRFQPRPGFDADTNAFAVRWNGRPVAAHRPDGTIGTAGWHQGEVVVTGTGFDRLDFPETGSNDGFGALLDAVTVTLVP